jgi:hypothetical protein
MACGGFFAAEVGDILALIRQATLVPFLVVSLCPVRYYCVLVPLPSPEVHASPSGQKIVIIGE